MKVQHLMPLGKVNHRGKINTQFERRLINQSPPPLEIKDNILDGTMLNPLYTLTLSRSNREVSEEFK